ncbi:hypothetical protein ACFIJ5_03750 [Haloimpatiens sp. FM7330]|uniref:hypothetical protein n=1 Tax=Haloimpatiens sp. FM7330 TaxID=3298610 RepID=UPI00362764FC
MDKKQEILKKYNMFLRIKKSIIFLGIISCLALTGYFIMDKMNMKFSVIFMILSIVFIFLFLVLLVSIRPMKKHILNIIKEYQK